MDTIIERATEFLNTDYYLESSVPVVAGKAIVHELLAEIVRLNDCSANCHQFHDSIIEAQKLTATRCAEIAANSKYTSRSESAHIAEYKYYNTACDRISAAISQEFNLSD